jgi:hypothetical protein
MVEVDANLMLTGAHGPLTLLDAFEGRTQLIAYYFMWHTGPWTRIRASWLRSTAVPVSTWWTRSPRAPRCPGLVPTVSINGARYIDGGVRSPDNADRASGYANVVVLSPLGEPGSTGTGRGPGRPVRGPAQTPEWGVDLASQVEAQRKQGSHVEVITPDAGSRAAMGTNQMDPATRIRAARAGFGQGKQEATRVRFL